MNEELPVLRVNGHSLEPATDHLCSRCEREYFYNCGHWYRRDETDINGWSRCHDCEP